MWYMLQCASIESVAAVPPVVTLPLLLTSSGTQLSISEEEVSELVRTLYAAGSTTTIDWDCTGKVCNFPLLLLTFVQKQL